MKKVIISNRAYLSMLAEVYERIKTETGGILLGHRDGDTWYVLESVEPGPKSIFTPTYFEYDDAYVTYRANKLSRLYKCSIELLGLWHRHPSLMKTFSSTDDGTNKIYSDMLGGAISGIVTLGNGFELTMYYVPSNVRYENIEWVVDDTQIPQEYLAYYDTEYYKQLINETAVHPTSTYRFSYNNTGAQKTVVRPPVQEPDYEPVQTAAQEDNPNPAQNAAQNPVQEPAGNAAQEPAPGSARNPAQEPTPNSAQHHSHNPVRDYSDIPVQSPPRRSIGAVLMGAFKNTLDYLTGNIDDQEDYRENACAHAPAEQRELAAILDILDPEIEYLQQLEARGQIQATYESRKDSKGKDGLILTIRDLRQPEEFGCRIVFFISNGTLMARDEAGNTRPYTDKYITAILGGQS